MWRRSGSCLSSPGGGKSGASGARSGREGACSRGVVAGLNSRPFRGHHGRDSTPAVLSAFFGNGTRHGEARVVKMITGVVALHAPSAQNRSGRRACSSRRSGAGFGGIAPLGAADGALDAAASAAGAQLCVASAASAEAGSAAALQRAEAARRGRGGGCAARWRSEARARALWRHTGKRHVFLESLQRHCVPKEPKCNPRQAPAAEPHDRGAQARRERRGGATRLVRRVHTPRERVSGVVCHVIEARRHVRATTAASAAPTPSRTSSSTGQYATELVE